MWQAAAREREHRTPVATVHETQEAAVIRMILIIILGYLIGSVPFALVIGKVFYNTDIREYGSGNLGG